MNFGQYKNLVKGEALTKLEANYSLFAAASSLAGLYPPYFDKYSDHDLGVSVFISEGEHGIIVLSLKNYEARTRFAFDKLIKTGQTPWVKDFENTWTQINDLYEKLLVRSLSEYNESQLEELINKSFDLYVSIFASTVFYEALDVDMIREFYKQVSDDEDEFDIFVENSTLVTFDSFVLRNDLALINALPENNYAAVQYILSDYKLTPDLNNSKKIIDKTVKERGGLESVRGDLEKQIKINTENKEKAGDFYKTLTEGKKLLFDFIQTGMRLRDTRKEPLQKIIAVLSNLTREVFERQGLNQEDIIYAFFTDFNEGTYNNAAYSQEIDKRKNGVVLYFSKEGIEFEYGEIAKLRGMFFSLIDSGTEKDVDSISGVVANKGKAKGKVSVILSDKDFAKFESGDILVTSMTRPEFVPLMKQSIAVITDEGGVTCHAAIVSRELNKPCIIGTKNASRALKDGDEVEVDAERGIVTILKKV